MLHFVRSAHATHCSYKGDAAYYSLKVDGRGAENAVWTYEAPYPAVASIKEHLAFYPDRVERDLDAPPTRSMTRGCGWPESRG